MKKFLSLFLLTLCGLFGVPQDAEACGGAATSRVRSVLSETANRVRSFIPATRATCFVLPANLAQATTFPLPMPSAKPAAPATTASASDLEARVKVLEKKTQDAGRALLFAPEGTGSPKVQGPPPIGGTVGTATTVRVYSAPVLSIPVYRPFFSVRSPLLVSAPANVTRTRTVTRSR